MLSYLLFLSVSETYKLQFQQRLNHLDAHGNEFFNQTFLTNFDPNISLSSPSLIVYLGGFSKLKSEVFDYPGIVALSSATNAKIIALEHRFFGDSVPSEGLTTENRNYLIIQQALADIDTFLEYVNNKFCPSKKCNIGLVGTGYAASLATWSRIRYPHLSLGVWASSAPLTFIDNFPDFDVFAGQRLKNIADNCLNSTQLLFNKIESVIRQGDRNEINALKDLFNYDYNYDNSSDDSNLTNYDEYFDDITFLYTIAEVLALPLHKNDNYTMISNYCQLITENTSIESFAKSYHEIVNYYNISSNYFNPYHFDDPELSDQKSKLWLQCNQIGWFRTASYSNYSLRSKLIDINYFNNMCSNTFDINLTNVSLSNEIFGGSEPYVSNVMFTNGEYDPYKALSVKHSMNVMGRHSLVIQKAVYGEDILSIGTSDDSSISKVRSSCIEKMNAWIDKLCEKNCDQGTCVLAKCVCIDMWDGEYCNRRTHTNTAYEYITAFCILVPTLLLLFFGSFVWFCGRKEDNEIGKSRQMFTMT